MMKKLLSLAGILAAMSLASTTAAEAHRHHAHHHHKHGFEQERLFSTDLATYYDVREDHPGEFGPYFPDAIWPHFHEWNHK